MAYFKSLSRSRRLLALGLTFNLLALLNLGTTLAADPAFNDPGFAHTWQRVDVPVQRGQPRSYTWGPAIPEAAGVSAETYNGPTRRVQYFDKARMEVNNPAANPNDLYYVTTGLLVRELVSGQRQDGDTTFVQLPPSTVQVAGDPNDNGANAVAPVYASFGQLGTFAGQTTPAQAGQPITTGIDRSGALHPITPVELHKLQGYDPVTGHNIADVFVDYANQSGPIWDGAKIMNGPLFFGNATYVLGRPLTEPYWSRSVVAGAERDVMIQLFERRVLTYTPANPAGFKVEMGNVGQHYYKWRYIINGSPTNLPADTTGRPQIGSEALLNVAGLPQLNSKVQTYLVTSHDPTGGNKDWTTPLYQEGQASVIFDQTGPGVLTRLWMTNKPYVTFPEIGRLQFFFDNETTPRADLTVEDFFSGTKPPFVRPLVGNKLVSSGGFYSYVPMAYARRLKIVTTGTPGYYQFNYQKLQPDQPVTTYTGHEDYSPLIRVLSGIGSDPKPMRPGRQTLTGQANVAANSEAVIPGLPAGPAVISGLKLHLTSSDPDALRRLNLRISWDGQPTPKVDAPLDFLFGSGLGEKSVAGLLTGINPITHQYYFYYPMPYHSGARVSLVNNGGQTAQVSWELGVDPDTDGSLVNANTGYFNATYRAERETPAGQDYIALNATGRGRYVGLVMNFYSDISAMEGDDQTYIDGSQTPQNGTGFEDYFNAAYGFQSGPFSQALSGSADKVFPCEPNCDFHSKNAPLISLGGYRYLLDDAVTFNSSLTVGFEQGAVGRNIPITGQVYKSLALWYGLDTPALQASDSLNLGDPASVSAHSYHTSGPASPANITSAFEGYKSGQASGGNGQALSGSSEFVVRTDPANNGVVLRRRFDYYDGRQQAMVYVNGQPVGVWFSPGQNQTLRWREEDFVIPASFTRGHSSLQIKIDATGSPGRWNEYNYDIFGFKIF